MSKLRTDQKRLEALQELFNDAKFIQCKLKRAVYTTVIVCSILSFITGFIVASGIHHLLDKA